MKTEENMPLSSCDINWNFILKHFHCVIKIVPGSRIVFGLRLLGNFHSWWWFTHWRRRHIFVLHGKSNLVRTNIFNSSNTIRLNIKILYLITLFIFIIIHIVIELTFLSLFLLFFQKIRFWASPIACKNVIQIPIIKNLRKSGRRGQVLLFSIVLNFYK